MLGHRRPAGRMLLNLSGLAVRCGGERLRRARLTGGFLRIGNGIVVTLIAGIFAIDLARPAACGERIT
jgi:hypothetical protein